MNFYVRERQSSTLPLIPLPQSLINTLFRKECPAIFVKRNFGENAEAPERIYAGNLFNRFMHLKNAGIKKASAKIQARGEA